MASGEAALWRHRGFRLLWASQAISLAGGVLADHLGLRTVLLLATAGSTAATAWLVLSPVRSLRGIP